MVLSATIFLSCAGIPLNETQFPKPQTFHFKKLKKVKIALCGDNINYGEKFLMATMPKAKDEKNECSQNAANVFYNSLLGLNEMFEIAPPEQADYKIKFLYQTQWAGTLADLPSILTLGIIPGYFRSDDRLTVAVTSTNTGATTEFVYEDNIHYGNWLPFFFMTLVKPLCTIGVMQSDCQLPKSYLLENFAIDFAQEFFPAELPAEALAKSVGNF